jgi:hypothetical protein
LTDEREAWENEVLAQRFARAGTIGGAIGGAPFGAVSGKGGARGARRAAGWMKNNVCELELTLPTDPQDALGRATEVLEERGQLIEQPYATPGVPTVAAVAGSTLQNPAVVTVEAHASADQATRVKIRAVAKISLLQRHTGEKVAEQIREALSQK